jgi:hypothetical protein
MGAVCVAEQEAVDSGMGVHCRGAEERLARSNAGVRVPIAAELASAVCTCLADAVVDEQEDRAVLWSVALAYAQGMLAIWLCWTGLRVYRRARRMRLVSVGRGHD